ncbi:MAG: DNA mismatch repair endonuclease MutL [Thermodesulfobacteriota bacterium]
MSRKIHVLPEAVAQAIAAGEVIERPASVVKELMENALDAGASEISVELKAGGLQLIRVFDNGEGIAPEDVPVALQRYATSKIERSEDLFSVQTLGFRGEALPSIAAVSQMTIKTRVPGSMSGRQAVCEGGEIRNLSEVGCPVGTEVEVKNLFYNIPVKRKFVKSIQTELRHSLSHFLRLSLAHPSVSFRFFHEGRLLHEVVKTDSPRVRVEAILGSEIASHLHPVAFEEGEIRLRGFASLPSFSKGNGDGIYLYVNRRFVKDRMIYKAILEAYRHLLPSGRFPVAILFVNLPPSAIDVNVHPTKAEVKFKDPESVFRVVVGALSSALPAPPSFTKKKEAADEEGAHLSFGGAPDPGWAQSSFVSTSLFDQDRQTPFVVKEAGAPAWGVEKSSPLRILGQVRNTYILCDGDEGLVLIDQHAAHERLLYEKYKKAHEAGAIPVERFLLPVPMELSTEESFVLMSYHEEMASMGFEIDGIGERMVAIRAIPKLTEPFDPKGLVRELLEELSFLKREGTGREPIHKMLVSLACHSAIRANSVLRREEMEGLVEALHPFSSSLTCPHGRPVFFILSSEDLAKQFKRKE